MTSGCSDDSTPQEEQTKNTQALCDSLRDMKTDAQKLASMDRSTSTLDDIKAARSDVSDAFQDVKEDAKGIGEAKADEISQAYDDLKSTVDGLAGDTTAGEAIQQVKPQVDKLLSAIRTSETSVSC